MKRSDIQSFLSATQWQNAVMKPLAGDASRRRYFRLKHPEVHGRAVLMDAPVESGEDVRPFVFIAHYLSSIGLSAPDIFHARPELGLLLIEDLGDDLFARVVAKQPELEYQLYETATDVLIHAHQQKPPDGLAIYTPDVMTEQASLILDWYLRGLSIAVSDAKRNAFTETIRRLLEEHAGKTDVLIQRDYHSENLLWLPERDDLKRVGLLDFQDATLGHRMYDLVSLLQDARRDVPPEVETAMRHRYAEAFGEDNKDDEAAYVTLGAQRNLRILGVFARLALRDGKAHYLDLMPRVWGLLQRDLAHPALDDLHRIVTDLVPAPSSAITDQLRQQCETSLMPS